MFMKLICAIILITTPNRQRTGHYTSGTRFLDEVVVTANREGVNALRHRLQYQV
jgi:hypothetical protein